MGSAVSVSSLDNNKNVQSVPLKKLPDAIEESVFVHEKFPLIIDPTEQASRFLKYQMGSFINYDDPIQMDMKNLNRCLLGALQYGRTMTLKFNTSLLDIPEEKVFIDTFFPKQVYNNNNNNNYYYYYYYYYYCCCSYSLYTTTITTTTRLLLLDYYYYYSLYYYYYYYY